jgi:hypothetical protein
MAHYVLALNLSTRPPRLPPDSRYRSHASDGRERLDGGWKNVTFARVMIRAYGRPLDQIRYRAAQLLLHAHIRRRLHLVACAYRRLAQTIDPETEGPYREWLLNAAAGAQEIIETLRSFKRPGLFAIVPFLLTVGAKASNTHLSRLLLVLVGVYGGSLTLILLTIFVAGFTLKRRICMTPLPGDQGQSVYRSEDDLFWLLGQRKPLEYPLDSFILLLLSVIVAEGAFLGSATAPTWVSRHPVIVIPGGVVAVALAVTSFVKSAQMMTARRGLR